MQILGGKSNIDNLHAQSRSDFLYWVHTKSISPCSGEKNVWRPILVCPSTLRHTVGEEPLNLPYSWKLVILLCTQDSYVCKSEPLAASISFRFVAMGPHVGEAHTFNASSILCHCVQSALSLIFYTFIPSAEYWIWSMYEYKPGQLIILHRWDLTRNNFRKFLVILPTLMRMHASNSSEWISWILWNCSPNARDGGEVHAWGWTFTSL